MTHDKQNGQKTWTGLKKKKISKWPIHVKTSSGESRLKSQWGTAIQSLQ